MEKLRSLLRHKWQSMPEQERHAHTSHMLRVVLPLFVVGMILVGGSSVSETMSRSSGVFGASGVFDAIVVGLFGGVSVVACYWVLASGLVRKKWFSPRFHDEHDSKKGAASE